MNVIEYQIFADHRNPKVFASKLLATEYAEALYPNKNYTIFPVTLVNTQDKDNALQK